MASLRKTLAGALLAVLLVTSGCLGLITGDEALEFVADPVSVSNGAVADAGYEHQNTTEIPIDETVEFQGEQRDIHVVNHLAIYQTAAPTSEELPRVGMVAVVSTPQAKILGQPVNPLGRVPYDQLVSQVLDRADGVQDVTKANERTVEILGEETTVVQFEGTVEMDGETVDVYLDVARVKHGDDFVIAVAVYPTATPGESDHVDTMFGGIQH